MKKYSALLLVLILSLSTLGQMPQRMSYQAIVRNVNGELIKNSNIGIKISILQGSASGSAAYIENHSISSNENGLVSIEIGGGTPVTGTFSAIDWSTGLYYLKTETDPDGGINYTISGTSQILSVPYSFYAQYAKTSTDAIKFHDPTQSVIGNNSPILNTGIRNILIGKTSGMSNTTGTYNTFIGSGAGYKNTIGNNNIAIGTYALRENNEGSENIAIGLFALEKNKVETSGSVGGAGFQNVAVGAYSLRNAVSNMNVAIGGESLQSLTTGGGNTGIGEHVMRDLVTGSNNTAIGYGSMINAGTDASNNIAIGVRSGQRALGGGNVFVGHESGESNKGSGNVFLGNLSGFGSYWENTSNRLIITNAASNTPLIYGEFDNPKVIINGNFKSTNGIDANNKIISNVSNPVNLTDATNKAYVDELKQRIQDLEDIIYNQLPVSTSGLVAYYPFNGNANDGSGSGNNGVVNGATLTVDRFGKPNSAYSFNRSLNNTLTVTFPTPLNTGTYSGITISVWCKLNDLNPPVSNILSLLDNFPKGFVIPWDHPAGKFYGLKQPTSVIYGSGSTSADKWYNLVYTLDAGTRISKFYINNVLQGELNNDSYMPLATKLLIGYHNSWDWGLGWYMNGIIDDIRIYSRAMSDAEVQQLYKEGGYSGN